MPESPTAIRPSSNHQTANPKFQNLSKDAILTNWPNQSDEKSGTREILEKLKEMQNRKEALTTTTQSESKSLTTRPTDPGGGIDGKQHLLPQLYSTPHFVFHWTNGADGGLPEDAPLPSGYLESLGEIFENVWNFTLNIRGYPSLPNDTAEPNDERNRNPDSRYDVFIYSFQYYGYAYPEQWPDSPSYSYIGIINSLGSTGLRQVVAAHEFFHAVQFVYDCTEEMWWMETSAVYMEDQVYPSVDNNYQYLPGWFQMSDTYGLTNDTGLHEYGNFIWAKRLSEDFGDEIIKEIWQEMSYTDGLEAINNTLVSKNSSLTEAFSKFITANFFLEEMYVDGADYRTVVTGETTFNGVWIEYEYDASLEDNYTVINNNNANYDLWMDRWAADYITLHLDPVKPVYNITFVGFDATTNYLVKLAIKKGGNITEQVFQLNDQKNGTVILSYDDYDNVTLIMANAGDTPTTHPSWNVIITVLSTEPGSLATIFVDPNNVTDAMLSPLEEFTVEVKIENAINLYHIALTLDWNASLLNHTSHTVKIPIEDYPDGILHTAVSLAKDKVNQTTGRYELNCSSVDPATPFNGSGTVFNITFRIMKGGYSYLNISFSDLRDINGSAIEHITENGYFNNIFYDVAITDLKVSTFSAIPGQTIDIDATVKNNGTTRNEAFNVSFYWNLNLIEAQPVLSLPPHNEQTLNLSWTIPSDFYGNGTIWANVTIVPEEDNVNNNRLEAGVLTIIVHNVGIKEMLLPKNLVGEGTSMNLTIVVSNRGSFDETTNVTLYVNQTIVEVLVTSLPAGQDKEMVLRVNFSAEVQTSLYENYTLSVEISPVPGEEDLQDNALTTGWIMITIPGDVDADQDIDIFDIVRIAGSYNTHIGEPGYVPNHDIDGNGLIDIYDVVIAANNYGKKS